MADGAPIRTPLIQHWYRTRFQLVPVLTFAAALVLTGWLWRRHGQLPSAVGEVEIVRIPVRTQYDGVLSALDSGPLEVFDPVEAGQVVARLDEGPALAALDALREEKRRLETELAAVAEQVRQDEAERGFDRLNEARRLAVDVERTRLTILSLQTELQADRVGVSRLDKLLEGAHKARAGGAAAEMEVLDLTLQRDETLERIRGHSDSLRQAEEDLKAGEARAGQHPTTQPAGVEALLEPIRRARAAQEARAREWELQVQNMTLRVPISGTICAIYRHPGQTVQAGEDILLVAADRGRHILAYVRQYQHVQPQVGMPVAVRAGPARPVQAHVLRVGPQIEEVPPHHRRDPARLEWGLPVLISMPEGAPLRPGELVDVVFKAGMVARH